MSEKEPSCGNCKNDGEPHGDWCFNLVGKCMNYEKFEPKEESAYFDPRDLDNTLKGRGIEDRLPGGTGQEPREDDFELIEKFIPPRNIRCEDCMANPKQELISEFVKDLRTCHEYDGTDNLLKLLQKWEEKL